LLLTLQTQGVTKRPSLPLYYYPLLFYSPFISCLSSIFSSFIVYFLSYPASPSLPSPLHSLNSSFFLRLLYLFLIPTSSSCSPLSTFFPFSSSPSHIPSPSSSSSSPSSSFCCYSILFFSSPSPILPLLLSPSYCSNCAIRVMILPSHENVYRHSRIPVAHSLNLRIPPLIINILVPERAVFLYFLFTGTAGLDRVLSTLTL
jgi:hypothetical protein